EYIAVHVFKNVAYVAALKIIAVALPFYTITIICIEFIRGLKKLKVSEFLRTVLRPTIIIFGLIVFANSVSVNESLYALLTAILLLFITAIFFLLKYFKTHSVNNSTDREYFSKKELVKTSLPMMIIMVFTSILGNAASYFLEYYGSTKDVGVFNICFKIAQLIGIVLIVVNTMAATKFAELYWNNKTSELKKILNQASKLNLLGGLTMAVVLFLFSDVILGFFGHEFLGAKKVLLILIIGQAINCASGSV